jgi:ferredoxin/NAD(P)H-dependent FMN reductase
MDITSVKLACFSPTGTTKAVLQAIGAGLDAQVVEWIDGTRPETRDTPWRTAPSDVLVVGVPVYMGRVPALLGDWLGRLAGSGTPAVCVVVYGNRAYENALLELTDIVRSRGCVPIAGAACVGEHSFSSPTLPTAQGRPDDDDLRLARAFGRQVRKKLQSTTSIDELVEVCVPGALPYGGVTKLWDVDFVAVDDRCAHCGACADACPMGAINPEESAIVDPVACITCCACIKTCPQGARSMKPGPVMDAATRLNRLYSARKEPEFIV